MHSYSEIYAFIASMHILNNNLVDLHTIDGRIRSISFQKRLKYHHFKRLKIINNSQYEMPNLISESVITH
ncbi:MAG: hypothetical protein WBH31_09065 [Promethearchaeia archaeon]